ITPTCSAGTMVSAGSKRSLTFTLTATDGCNNAATCPVTYTWTEDTTAPTISGCPSGPIDLKCNPTRPTCDDAKNLVSVSGTCDTAPVLDCAPGTVTGTGCHKSQTFTLTAKDACGNVSAPCLVTYTWTEDAIAPTISGCPS